MINHNIIYSLFKLHPPTRAVFGFSDLDDDPCVDSPTTAMHARAVVSMFDSVLQMLGPDTDLVEEILSSVGQRHKNYGVTVAYFPFMGQALVNALKTTLGEAAFTKDHVEAWEEVYKELSSEIVKSM
jgi:hemoglobin-like flavoprotein